MSWGVATQNGVSVSLASIVSLSCGATEFSPASLFTSGVQGAWYDPSDYSTLFQDSAGTTPVTAVEQPVGKMLDKSGNNNHATQATTASRPVLRARYNNFVGTATLATQNVTTLAATYKLSFTGTGSITLSGTATGTYSAGTNAITCTAGTLTATVSGTVTNADLRLSSTATSMPAYQRVTTATDYDAFGFLPYLALDGTDDSMTSSSVNFSATDKMAVVAGVTKLTDTGDGNIVELSSNVNLNSGAFYFWAPEAVGLKYTMLSRGTAAINVNQRATTSSTTYNAPSTVVLSGVMNISGDSNELRLNATSINTATGDQGTGNYGNYPLYIGRRGGSTVPFNGRIYQMVVCGKALSASELASTEAYVNTKTGAY